MMKNLPGEQVNLLEKAFKESSGKRETLRFQALLLLSQGYRRKEVSQIVRISLCALGNWVTAFNKAGVKGLREKDQPGNHRKLTIKQKEELKTLITAQTPQETNFAGIFWTPKLVSKLVMNLYQISYQQEACRRLLLSFGLSFHKPHKVNIRQKEKDRVRFEEKLKKDSSGIREKMTWSW